MKLLQDIGVAGRGMRVVVASIVMLALASGASGTAFNFTDDGATFTNATDYYYPTVVKQGGTYHMWMQDHAALDDVWYTSSADGKTTWSTPVQCLAGGAQMKGWNTHPSVIDTGTAFRMYYTSSTTRVIDVAEASYATPTTWSLTNTNVVPPGHPFHYSSADVHHISQWYDAYVYKYDGHYEAFLTGDYGLHYVTSPDGITGWTPVNTSHPVTGTPGYPVFQKSGVAADWDSGTMGKPTVLRLADDEYHMWYGSGKTGDPVAYAGGIGYATSTDGIEWTRDPANPLFHVSDGVAYRSKRTYTPWVFIDGTEAKMYFSAENATGGADSIGLATAPYSNGGGPVIPEPVTICALGLAVAGLGGYVRRRRQA